MIVASSEVANIEIVLLLTSAVGVKPAVGTADATRTITLCVGVSLPLGTGKQYEPLSNRGSVD